MKTYEVVVQDQHMASPETITVSGDGIKTDACGNLIIFSGISETASSIFAAGRFLRAKEKES